MDGTYNSKTEAGRIIHRKADGTCFFYGDFPEGTQVPPGTAPPIEAVQCPPTMNHPVWESCVGGVLQEADEGCVCATMGNPPPPPKPVDCPTDS